jgi:hypothetical protein
MGGGLQRKVQVRDSNDMIRRLCGRHRLIDVNGEHSVEHRPAQPDRGHRIKVDNRRIEQIV